MIDTKVVLVLVLVLGSILGVGATGPSGGIPVPQVVDPGSGSSQ
jgi:hypothetical protein